MCKKFDYKLSFFIVRHQESTLPSNSGMLFSFQILNLSERRQDITDLNDSVSPPPPTPPSPQANARNSGFNSRHTVVYFNIHATSVPKSLVFLKIEVFPSVIVENKAVSLGAIACQTVRHARIIIRSELSTVFS